MAPLTRGRSTREHVPTALMQTYYSQRAAAGLIITEATGISRAGARLALCAGPVDARSRSRPGSRSSPAVHEAGGRIFAQLWHMGRLVHSSFLGGGQPVSASATTAPHKAHTYDGRQPYEEARALRLDETSRSDRRL